MNPDRSRLFQGGLATAVLTSRESERFARMAWN
jgi:hypothetical protein